MLHTLAIAGYRSLQNLVVPLGQLTVVTGPNGSGKSNLYRALRLLSYAGKGQLISSLAAEGGLQSTLWAGAPRPGHYKEPVSLRLGFTTDDFTFTTDLGLPIPSQSAFALDPIIKRECLWRGMVMRPSTLWADRRGPIVKCRDREGAWNELATDLPTHASMLTEFSNPMRSLDLMMVRDSIHSWRFYDHFRVDNEAPARQAQIGTYTPVLSDDGSSLAATLQTIREIGDRQELDDAVADAFDGSHLLIDHSQPRFQVMMQQPRLLRPLEAKELSDGTLRYLLLLAALFSPRPAELLVFNEPEASLHPELLPALGRAMTSRTKHSQMIVVTHSMVLAESLHQHSHCIPVELAKSNSATYQVGAGLTDTPVWKWPAR